MELNNISGVSAFKQSSGKSFKQIHSFNKREQLFFNSNIDSFSLSKNNVVKVNKKERYNFINSFLRGMIKGASIATLGPFYPVFTSAFAIYDSAFESSKDKNDKDNLKDSGYTYEEPNFKNVKSASMKGFVNGILEMVSIGSLALVAGFYGSISLAFVTSILAGGFYNVIKDKLSKD